MNLSLVARFLLLSPILVGPGPQSGQTRPLGEWRLDPAHSDSLRAHFGSRWRSDGPWTGGPPDQYPGSPRPGGGTGSQWRSADGELMELLRHPPEQVHITSDSLTLVDDSGSTVSWRIDGKARKRPLQGGGDLVTSVRWKDDALRIERKIGGRGKLVETYELGLGGSRLIAFIELSGFREPLSLTRVYQPADSAGRASQ